MGLNEDGTIDFEDDFAGARYRAIYEDENDTEGMYIGDLTGVRILDGAVANGDSGGTVFNMAEYGTENINFCGVINARATHSTGELEMYFTPASFFSAQGFSVKTS